MAVDTGVGRAEVVRDRAGRGRTLLIDGQVHGHVDADDPSRLELDYQDRLATIALALLPDRAATIVHLGGGAVAVPRALAAARGDLDQLVVERSAAVIGLAERELGLRRTDHLRIRKGDGRAAVERLPDRTVDLVIGDAFLDDRTPPHMATVEFMAEVRRVLAPAGAYVVNLIDEQPYSRVGAQAAAAETAFTDVVAAGSRGVARLRDPGNVFVVAAGRVPREQLVRAGSTARHPVALVADGTLRGLVRANRPRSDADG